MANTARRIESGMRTSMQATKFAKLVGVPLDASNDATPWSPTSNVSAINSPRFQFGNRMKSLIFPIVPDFISEPYQKLNAKYHDWRVTQPVIKAKQKAAALDIDGPAPVQEAPKGRWQSIKDGVTATREKIQNWWNPEVKTEIPNLETDVVKNIEGRNSVQYAHALNESLKRNGINTRLIVPSNETKSKTIRNVHDLLLQNKKSLKPWHSHTLYFGNNKTEKQTRSGIKNICVGKNPKIDFIVSELQRANGLVNKKRLRDMPGVLASWGGGKWMDTVEKINEGTGSAWITGSLPEKRVKHSSPEERNETPEEKQVRIAAGQRPDPLSEETSEHAEKMHEIKAAEGLITINNQNFEAIEKALNDGEQPDKKFLQGTQKNIVGARQKILEGKEKIEKVLDEGQFEEKGKLDAKMAELEKLEETLNEQEEGLNELLEEFPLNYDSDVSAPLGRDNLGKLLHNNNDGDIINKGPLTMQQMEVKALTKISELRQQITQWEFVWDAMSPGIIKDKLRVFIDQHSKKLEAIIMLAKQRHIITSV